ncbi:hypothetical protein D3C87_973720 [compost metagenome]
MELTPGKWNIAPITATYEAHATRAQLAAGARSGVSFSFRALSIGNENAQVAIIPMDNAWARDNAAVLARAADMYALILRMEALAVDMFRTSEIEGDALIARTENFMSILLSAVNVAAATRNQPCPT